VLVSFSYRFRDSLIERIDPRARWIVSLTIMAAIVMMWDIRFEAVFFCLALLQVLLSKVTWKETRRAWLFMFLLVTSMVLINVLITRGATQGTQFIEGRPIWNFQATVPLTGWKINYIMTTGQLFYGLGQYIRILSISSLFIIIPFTMDPRVYGVTFARLGQKVAFALDLAFRFIPTLARDFSVTLDAQRARGYEVEKVEGGLIAQIRKVAPLFIPVTMNAILTGEDITNAMDLRCFGLRRRTWVKVLTFHYYDYILMGAAAAILIGCFILRYGFAIGNFWLPASLY
jgi:energy-coupling factor transport system permease protein